MSWLSLIRGLVGLARALTGLFRDRQLIKSGEANQEAKQSRKVLDMARRANAARRALAHDDASVRHDSANRDNHG